jgi:biopolymer transport protein ExbB
MTTSLGNLFFTGGWVMWPLLILSVLSWAVVLERAFVFLTLRPRLTRLAQAVQQSLKSGDTSAARQLCHAEKPLVAEVFLSSLDARKGRDAAERATERSRLRMVTYLKKNLWILGTVASASPFIGLLGTVVGIVRAFHDMAEKARAASAWSPAVSRKR